MRCPTCGHDPQKKEAEKGVESEVKKGGSVFSDLTLPGGKSSPEQTPQIAATRRARGKAREYSSAFEAAWKAYGRREEKLRAYGEWLVAAREAGGETLLLPLILSALSWQSKIWEKENWKYAPYFERYLKRRKWEDERPRLRVVGGDDLPDPTDPANWEIPR